MSIPEMIPESEKEEQQALADKIMSEIERVLK